MLIGELVKRSGITKDAIRFYERKGLIHLNKSQRRQNNYKEYSDEVLHRLLLIKTVKGFGFTIKEIDRLFEQWRVEENYCNVKDTVGNKIAQIDDQISRLSGLKRKLLSSYGKCEKGKCEFKIQSLPR